MKLRKRFAAFVLACVMVVGGAVSVFADDVAAPAAVEETVELASTTNSPSGGATPVNSTGVYDHSNGNRGNTWANGSCKLTKNNTYLKDKTVYVAKKFTTKKGVTYKITTIAAKTFYKNTKATRVVLSQYVHRIYANAFKTKTGAVATVKLTAKTMTLSKGALNGVKKVQVPKARLAYYKKILKAAGFKGTITTF